MMPCETHFPRSCTWQDMLQEGYAMQWGAKGRNDLGRMKAMGVLESESTQG